jgi:phosphate transport system substrate-binding protein
MEQNIRQICPKCGYSGNPEQATHCYSCNHPLHLPYQPDNKPFLYSWLVPFLAVGILMCVVGILSYLRKETSTADNISSSDNTQSVQQQSEKIPVRQFSDKSNKSNSGLDVKLYNSLQEVENVPEGLFNYAGAVTFANLTAHGMNKAITAAHPEFRLRYTEPVAQKPGSGTASTMLIDGQVSFAQTARPLEDEEYEKAKIRGFGLEQVPVFIDGIAFYTHPSVKVPGLSLDRVQAIFMGKITNWKQVGGPDLPIKPFSQDPKASSVISLLLKDKGNDLGRNVQIIYDISDAIRKVSSTPGAISYASPSLVIKQRKIRPVKLAKAYTNKYVPFITKQNQVNTEAFRDGSYPLTRRLFVVIRRDGTLDEQAGLAYINFLLSKEGQKLIEKAGFVPIR